MKILDHFLNNILKVTLKKLFELFIYNILGKIAMVFGLEAHISI